MKLSILLVCHNQIDFIDECLNGVLIQQIDKPFELIIADDCSTDGTAERIQTLLENQSISFQLLPSEQNIGMGRNYLRGIGACAGDLIALLEGDDYWTDPLRLQKHVTFLEENPDCPMSFNPYQTFHQAQNQTFSPPIKEDSSVDFFDAKTLIQYNVIGNLSACVIKKTALESIPKKWFEYNITDWLIGIYLAEQHPVAQLKKIMSGYRINPKGLWSRFSEEEQIRKKEKLTKTYDFLLGHRFSKEFRAFRIASRFKRWRDQIRKNSPTGIRALLEIGLSQGIIIRVSRLVSYSLPYKPKKTNEEIYNIF